MNIAEASVLFPDYINRSDVLVSLMRENGYLNWDRHFFQYHYIDFPHETHSFFLLTDEGKVVGHIAFRENFINATDVKSCWAMHALIDKNHRNLSNFIYLVRNAENYLASYGYDFIFAMPNLFAAEIYKKCLSWSDVGYVNFSLSSTVPRSATRGDQFFYFRKSTEWWKWRLKINKEPKLVRQIYSWNNIDVSQILYVSQAYFENSSEFNFLKQDQPICLWDHANYTNKCSWWSCRFMSKSLARKLNKRILDISCWHVDMIDSDAFSCANVQIL